MTFEFIQPGSGNADLPQLEALRMIAPMQGQAGLSLGETGLGVVPFLIGGVAAGSAVSSWLQNDDWSIGEYNLMVREIGDAFTIWDSAGWRSGCWAKYPTKRAQFKALWIRFGLHHREYGIIGECFSFGKHKYTCLVPDSAEKPLRDHILPQLQSIGRFLNNTCGTRLEVGRDPEPEAPKKDIFTRAERKGDSGSFLPDVNVGVGGAGALVAVGFAAALFFMLRR